MIYKSSLLPLLFTATHLLLAADPHPSGAEPDLVHLGALTLKPGAFLELIGMSRSSTTADSVSTKFGRIPLGDTPWETIGSARHSRLMLKSELPAGDFHFTTYLESDFMNFTTGQSPWRWRQYWGQASYGKWELLGGQAWSLLRPNRIGTDSDKNVMSTDVIDPAYEVGLLGSRVRQIRIARPVGDYKIAVAWEADGNLLTKVVRDKKRTHYELGAFGGRFGRKGATASAVISLTPKLRFVNQQYWSKRAAYQALGVMPIGPNGLSTIEGAEFQMRRNTELYTYGGMVYANRMDTTANRIVRQWSAGVNQKFAVPANWHGGMMFSLQYSHMDRAVWNGKEGAMDYLMYRFRYTLN